MIKTPSEFQINNLLDQVLAHVYDPVKAHEYYIRNRDLKGRKKAKQPKTGSAKSVSDQIKKQQAHKHFLENTPTFKDGASLADTEKFVNLAKTMSDDQLKQLSKKLKTLDKKSTGPEPFDAQARTIDALLTSRGKTRNSRDPRTGKTRTEISKNARAKQRKELQGQVQNLENKLQKLEALIKERTHEEASVDRKSKAKKERSAKEQDKPKSAADKAQAARENEKYRDKHKQELKSKAKSDSSKSGGSSSKSKSSSSKHSVSELNSLAKKVRGQIAVAKQKIAAL